MKKLFALLAMLGLVVADCAAADSPFASRNNHAPIEVTSDALEVMQQENRAVFSGHVVVIQGNVRMMAATMTVYYSPQDKKSKKNTQDGAIDRIDADGDVFLSTGQETASGTHGTYDVKNQEILLTGKVVLTRGQNVLKGDRLVYNFASGKSTFSGGGGPAVAGQPDRKPGERVRALFVPEKKDKP